MRRVMLRITSLLAMQARTFCLVRRVMTCWMAVRVTIPWPVGWVMTAIYLAEGMTKTPLWTTAPQRQIYLFCKRV